ncbi:MAG: GTP-binding protein [Candidatus Brocadiae bacterium]|nr:GTP-binding protein [Candidatus Brocadiia bacterium]
MAKKRARACIITPPGEGGIGIIALWGARAAEVLDEVFVGTRRRARALGVGAIAHGTIRRDGQAVDEVIVARVAATGAAPGALRFEVNCHGGIVAVRAALKCLQEAGAQVVEPGEAAGAPPAAAHPLSGAVIRARALAQLPRAPTRLAATMLLHQAAGATSKELEGIAELLAAGEAARAEERIEALLRTARLGRALLQPPRVALLGPPNVGKSTLLNALLEEERVIVHHEPGTTRDIVAETVSMRGVPFELLDSAGIRAAQDELEQQAVGRAAALAGTCDAALLMFDAREGPQGALESVPALNKEARLILVGNKIDLLPGDPPQHEPAAESAGSAPVYISAKAKANLPALESALLHPYEGLIEHCRRGGAVLFDRVVEDAIREVRGKLRNDGVRPALAALQALRG